MSRFFTGTFALEIHDVISPLWWFSTLDLWETIFKTHLKSKATVGGSRCVGGMCVCVCVCVWVFWSAKVEHGRKKPYSQVLFFFG